jgi:ATP-dependent DNA helicase RecG
MGRLEGLHLVATTGRTKAKRNFVKPSVLKALEMQAPTTLTRIEPHRLQELILEDLRRYPGSAIGAIRRRIGPEIPPSQVKRAIETLTQQDKVLASGKNRGRRYEITP